MKINRVVMSASGAPEVMKLENTELAAPGAGEVQIAQTAIGLNYMDVYQRSGAYSLPLPSPLGLEAAGEVIAVGEDVSDLEIGDRVVYGGVLGAYASHRNAPAARCINIPDGISDEQAAAVLMKGLTVEYLLNRTYCVKAGQDVLFWAASGGVGQLAGQWGKHIGARMIGVTSGVENCDSIKSLGYAEAIDRKNEDVGARVRELTDGRGVPVVYDSVGKASFEASIESLATYGMFVSFGATTGLVPDVSAHLLQVKGSLYFTRPTLANYVASREDLVHSASETFRLMQEGVLSVNINQRFALSDIVDAHIALESGETTGSTILTP
jgi:NADPH2:quinone reductase|tara:strand:- start:45 stop:1019 length:975 start_codon:yes stop_codon:yes gene_type:complete